MTHNFSTPTLSELAERLLLTNSPPSALEEIEIRAYLEAEEKNFDVLDKEIEQLRMKRERSAQYVRDHRSILSPLRRLPVEILGDIVSLACRPWWQQQIWIKVSGRMLREAPWTFSYVSSRWRSVTIGLASLWTGIFIRVREPRSVHMNTALCTALERSKNMPLSLWCEMDDESDPRLLDNILAVSARWQTVDMLSIPISSLPRMQQLRNSIPLLEVLQLVLWDGYKADNQLIIDGGWLADAPKLHSLKFLGCDIGPLNTFPIPWSQLNVFECLSNRSLPAELERLGRLTSLQTYEVLLWNYDLSVEDHPPLPLPSLQHLEIGKRSSSQLISLLRAPNLQRLTWEPSENVHRDGTTTALRLLLHAASSTVNDIHISVLEENTEDESHYWLQVMDVLSKCSHTINLTLSVGIQFMVALAIDILPLLKPTPEHSEGRLPALQSIHITMLENGWMGDADDRPRIGTLLLKSVEAVLTSRGTILKSFSLVLSHAHLGMYLDVFTASAMRQLRQKCPDIEISIDVAG